MLSNVILFITLNPLWIRVAYQYFQIILSLKPGEMLLTETLINVLHNGDEVVYYISGLGICVCFGVDSV